jgi:signal transduction histidine kinase
MTASRRGSEVGVNLSIVKKGLVLAAIPLLTQLVFLAMLFKMRQDQQQAQEWAIHSKEVIVQTEGAFRQIMEARTAVFSLASTGDPVFLSGWEKSRKEAPAQLRALRNLVSDNPPQQMRIDQVLQQTEGTLARLDAIAQLARRPQTRSDAAAALREPWALQFVDDLRLRINDFLSEEARLDGERQIRLGRVHEEETWTLIGGAVLTLLSTILLALAFRRSISARLNVLMENVRHLAGGEQLATPLGGRDELGRLDHVFHEMADTLAQKDRENEMFVYSVSHDLRSPLVNLQGFSQELALVCRDLQRIVMENTVPASVRNRVTELLDRDAKESIQFIQTAVRRLATIIDALLRLSRVGRVVYDWQQVDVCATVQRVVAALGNTIAQKGARVEVGEFPPAWGDPTAIEQIFANLVGNALNYLDPARPGVIEVSSGRPHPAALDHPAANAAGSPQNGEPAALAAGWSLESHTYYVKDNGLGIEREHLPKVFLAFQRLHPTVAPGEGIGLPLVRRTVERHGGRIWVESEVGQGSTFFVSLPAQPREGAMHVPARNEAAREGAQSSLTQEGESSTWQRSRSA